MKKLLIMIPVALMIAAAAGANPPAAAWSAAVRIDTVAAEAGEHVGVPIYLINNNEEFAALYIPLRVASSCLTVDSVSFIGSIMPADFTGLLNPFTGSGDTIEITLAPDIVSPIPTISATDGLIATLWVTLASVVPPGVCLIDTFVVDSLITDGGPSVRIWKSIHGSDPFGVVLEPNFVRGGVAVDYTTGIDDDQMLLPTAFALAQNYPNPFNPSTVIEFAIPRSGVANLTVFNVLGQEVTTLINGPVTAGVHQVTFEAASHPSGIYFYRLAHEEGVETRKMTLLK